MPFSWSLFLVLLSSKQKESAVADLVVMWKTRREEKERLGFAILRSRLFEFRRLRAGFSKGLLKTPSHRLSKIGGVFGKEFSKRLGGNGGEPVCVCDGLDKTAEVLHRFSP